MPPLARTSSRPTFGRPANRYLSRDCFGQNGEVWCFCNTEPRVEALRRVTRKESSPNLGREFYSCGNWQEPKCEFFLWVDESAQKGRQNATPPPNDGPIRPTTPAAPVSRSSSRSAASTSPTKRIRTPPPSSARAPARAPASSSSKRPVPASERLDDLDFDSFDHDLSNEVEDDDDDDDIDDPDTEPETLEHSSSASARAEGTDGQSPTKRARFSSFGVGRAGTTLTTTSSSANRVAATRELDAALETPTKGGGGRGGPSATRAQGARHADMIKLEPDGPVIDDDDSLSRRNLFRGGGRSDGTGDSSPPLPTLSSPLATATPGPSRFTDASPSSLTNTTTMTASAAVTGQQDALSALAVHLEHLAPLMAQSKKDRERDQRLVEVGKKKEEMWKKRSGNLEQENGQLKQEIERLQQRVRGLEEQVTELRTRR